MSLRGVTFDYWNTLVFEERGHLRGRRTDAWLGILEEAGHDADRAAIEAVFDEAWAELDRAWRNEGHLSSEEAAHLAVDFWWRARGGDPADAHLRARLVESFLSSAADAELHLTPNVEDALRALHARGVRLGIVCDVGFTPSSHLRAFLDRAGVLELFQGVAFSDEVGVYKPSPKIFDVALSKMGVAPEDAAHVGDLRRTDVAGSRAMGMTAVRYTGVWDDDSQPEPEGDVVISDHAQLLLSLGWDR